MGSLFRSRLGFRLSGVEFGGEVCSRKCCRISRYIFVVVFGDFLFCSNSFWWYLDIIYEKIGRWYKSCRVEVVLSREMRRLVNLGSRWYFFRYSSMFFFEKFLRVNFVCTYFLSNVDIVFGRLVSILRAFFSRLFCRRLKSRFWIDVGSVGE